MKKAVKMITLQFGYNSVRAFTLPLDSCVDGGYPLAYYTDDNAVLCAKCATAQIKANSQRGAIVTHGERVVAADYYPGCAIDHGIVTCENCHTAIVSLDVDEWECYHCGSVREKGSGCQCGNTEDKQARELETAAQVAAGQLALPI